MWKYHKQVQKLTLVIMTTRQDKTMAKCKKYDNKMTTKITGLGGCPQRCILLSRIGKEMVNGQSDQNRTIH